MHIKGLGHETEFKYGWKWIVLGKNKNFYWFLNFQNARLTRWDVENLQEVLFLQYIFTLTAGKIATAIAHQRNISEI